MADENKLSLSSLLPSPNSIVNGIVGLIGAKKQRDWEEKQQQQQMDWNEQMMDKQNAFNVNMWNMQNAYNDPSAQYQRMLNSGYNPLYYGPEGAGNSSAMESAQALGYERASNVQNPLTAGVQSYLNTMQVEAQAKANVAKAKESEANADWTNAKTVTENLMRGVNFELAGLDIDLKSANIKLTENEAELVASDSVRITKECDLLDAKIQEAIVDMDVKQRSLLLQEMAFAFEKEIRTKELSLDEQRVAVQWYNANVNAILSSTQAEVNRKQSIYLDVSGEHIKAVTQTENDSRTYVVERAKWDASNSRRDYKWKPVNNTVKAVGTGVAAAGVAFSTALKAASSLAQPVTPNTSPAGSQYIESPMFYE